MSLFQQSVVQPDIVVHSGVLEIDELLGGFKAGELTLIDGNSDLIRNLPTQICVNTYHTFHSDTVYIDGGMCADPYRLACYARQMELDQRELLEHVRISRAFTVYQLSTLIQELLEPLIQQYHPRTLVMGMFPALYLDPDVPSHEAQTLLHHNLEKLRELTVSYRLITIFTNQDAFGLSSRRTLRDSVYETVAEIVRLRERDRCIMVDLVKQQKNTTMVCFSQGQLRLDAFGSVT
jgi:hypothetical protein